MSGHHCGGSRSRLLPGNIEADEINVPKPNVAAEWSELVVASVRGTSRAITCKNILPLKMLNPRSLHDCCHIVLSNYGGGMVQGDQVRLRITCERASRLYMGSQANTRIFKNPEKQSPCQVLQGRLKEGAFAVINPDPVVPHEGSSFRQSQEWHVDPTSSLLLVDWISSGRSESSESFAYRTFESETRIRSGGKTVLVDRFASDPTRQSPSAFARFGPYQTLMNIYFWGSRLLPVAEQMKRQYPNPEVQQVKELSDASQNTTQLPDRLVAVNEVEKQGYMLRALGKRRRDLQPVLQCLFVLLADADLLGFNPLDRKY